MSFNIDKICRICLDEGVLTSVFSLEFSIPLSDMIESCTRIKVNKNDGLPSQICSNCVYKLGIAYHFKKQSENADTKLKRYLGIQAVTRYKDTATITDTPDLNTLASKVMAKRNCKCEPKPKAPQYKKKPESEKLKRGPKPKPKQNIQCYECGQDFKCRAQLETHIRTHTGERPFSCVYCPRNFTQKHNLAIHMRIHTGERPFQCEICSKTFSALGNLQTHRKIHLGQRDQICLVCNKGFITSSELSRHMTKHTGIKDHKCDICQAAFSQNRDLKLHKIKKHNMDEGAIADSKQLAEVKNTLQINVISQSQLVHKCFTCKKILGSVAELGRHCASEHPVYPPALMPTAEMTVVNPKLHKYPFGTK